MDLRLKDLGEEEGKVTWTWNAFCHCSCTISAFCFAASPQTLNPQKPTEDLSDPLNLRVSRPGLPAAKALGVTHHGKSLTHSAHRGPTARPAVGSCSTCSESYSLEWLPRRRWLNEWFSTHRCQDLAGVWGSLWTHFIQASSSSYQRGPVSTLLVRLFDQVSSKQVQEILGYLKRQSVNCSCTTVLAASDPKLIRTRTKLIDSVIPKEGRTVYLRSICKLAQKLLNQPITTLSDL